MFRAEQPLLERQNAFRDLARRLAYLIRANPCNGGIEPRHMALAGCHLAEKLVNARVIAGRRELRDLETDHEGHHRRDVQLLVVLPACLNHDCFHRLTRVESRPESYRAPEAAAIE